VADTGKRNLSIVINTDPKKDNRYSDYCMKMSGSHHLDEYTSKMIDENDPFKG